MLFRPGFQPALRRRPVHLIADYRAYADCQTRLYERIADDGERARLAIMNTAQSGIFAADRAIEEYAKNIWHVM